MQAHCPQRQHTAQSACQRLPVRSNISRHDALLLSCVLQVGIGTLVWGPASDKFGRRTMYIVGMVLFLGTTLGCLFAPTIGVLVAFRGLQGLAGRATLVYG